MPGRRARSLGRNARNMVGRWVWRQKQRLPLLRAAFVRGLRFVGWRRLNGPRTRPGKTVRTGGQAGDIVPVVMSVWQRPDNLPETLAALESQSHQAIKLCVWNNNRSLRSAVDARIADASGLEVEVLHSSHN